MNELEKYTLSTSQKEYIKQWLKQQMSTPYDSEAKRQEIDQAVERAAQCADIIVETAERCGIDLDKFILKLFGLQ